jgi:hypothetical protein
MAVSGLGLAYVAGGFVLLWSGYKNASVKDTLTSFLKGQTPAANPTGSPSIGVSSSTTPSSGGGSTDSTGSELNEPGNAASGTVSTAAEAANKTLGESMAAAYGWTGTEWTDLNNIVMAESGWNNLAQNPNSTAYGIFQFLDTTWASVGYTKTSDPVTQIAAGLKYIKQRYGDPVSAWAFHLANGWY